MAERCEVQFNNIILCSNRIIYARDKKKKQQQNREYRTLLFTSRMYERKDNLVNLEFSLVHTYKY